MARINLPIYYLPLLVVLAACSHNLAPPTTVYEQCCVGPIDGGPPLASAGVPLGTNGFFFGALVLTNTSSDNVTVVDVKPVGMTEGVDFLGASMAPPTRRVGGIV